MGIEYDNPQLTKQDCVYDMHKQAWIMYDLEIYYFFHLFWKNR